MNTSELFILIGGILSILMVIFHCLFYKLFSWEAELEKVQTLNHRIFITIHIALILLFFVFGFISIFYYQEMASCKGLSLGIVFGYAIFWLWRAIWQMIYFKVPKDLKKPPIMHYALILIFGLLFVSYVVPVVLSL